MEAHGTFHTSHCLECRQEYALDWMKGRKQFDWPVMCTFYYMPYVHMIFTSLNNFSLILLILMGFVHISVAPLKCMSGEVLVKFNY